MLEYLKSLNLPYPDTARVRWGLLRAMARVAQTVADAVTRAMREWWPTTAGDTGLAVHAAQLGVTSQTGEESDRDYRLRVARQPADRRTWGRRGATGDLLDGVPWREYPRHGARVGYSVVGGGTLICADPVVRVGASASADQLTELRRRLAPDIAVTVADWSGPNATADAGEDRWVRWGQAVSLDGGGSRNGYEGSITGYAWVQTAGAAVVLTGANTSSPSFVAPGVDADLTFELTITDSAGGTDTATVTIRVGLQASFDAPAWRRTIMLVSIVRGSDARDAEAFYRAADSTQGGLSGVAIGSVRDGSATVTNGGTSSTISRVSVGTDTVDGRLYVILQDHPDPDSVLGTIGITARAHFITSEGAVEVAAWYSGGADWINWTPTEAQKTAIEAIMAGRSFVLAVTVAA